MTDVVGRAERTWRRVGVRPAARREMAAELRADLDAAQADGRDPAVLVGDDVDAFALAWATERGEMHARGRYPRTVLAMLAGLVAGAPVGAAASGLVSWMREMFAAGSVDYTDGRFLIAGYALTAVGAYAGALVVTYWALRRAADGCAGRTLRALALALPVGGVLATAAGVGAAAGLNFERTRNVILLVATIAAGVVVVATLGARWWALRTGARHPSGGDFRLPVAA
jgi:hypothetical protein